MDLASNIARREGNNRKGSNSYVAYTYRQYGKYCYKLEPQYCTWYAYEREPLYAYCAGNDWSIKDFHKTKPLLYFDFIPFDFDADNAETAFNNALAFVLWLERQGIPAEHFSIWLSGSKGFHVEVSRLAFDTESPSLDILRRLKQFCERLVKQLKAEDSAFEVDMQLYSATRLYRVWNTKHKKTGLYKTHIPRVQFTWEYAQAKAEWAAHPGDHIPIYPDEPPAVRLPLPLVEGEARESFLAAELIVDTGLSIIDNCPAIQKLMANPEGREARRQAAGILMEAYGSSFSPEVERLYEAWESSAYMNDTRMADALKWQKEYETDGVIKCNKTCTAFGCLRQQKRICGTQFPSDHLLKREKLKPIPIEEARELSNEWKREAAYSVNNNVYVFEEPIGFGKTTGFIKILAEDHTLTALWLCPTHGLARQVMKDMLAAGIDSVRHLMSRPEILGKEESTSKCLFFAEVSAAMNNGANTTKLVCSKCPRFAANVGESGETPCEYFEQYDGLKDVRVVIGMHAHTNPYIYEQCGLEERTLLIVDENALDAFSNHIKPIPYDVQGVLQGFGSRALDELTSELEAAGKAPAEAPTEPVKGYFGAARLMAARQQAKAMLEAHEEAAPTRQAREALARFVYAALRAIIGGAGLSPEDAELLKEVNYVPQYLSFLQKLVDLSKFDRALAMREGYQLLVFPNIVENATTCALAVRKPYKISEEYFFPGRLPDKRTVILDATGHKDLYQRMLKAGDPNGERELIYHKLPIIKQTQAQITQVTNSGYSKTRITSTEDALERLTFVIRSLRSTFTDAKILVVCMQGIQDEVTAAIDDPRTTIHHFGELRGLNEYADHDYQIILGGFFVPNKAITEGLNRLGFFNVDEDQLEANAVIYRNRHIALDGSSYFSQRKAFRATSKDGPMRYANLILHQRAISEVVQAIRIRLYSGAPDKRIFILTNVGLTSIYADRFVTLDELTNDLEELSDLKSEIEESRTRKTALMEAKLARLEVGAEFTYERLSNDKDKASWFLRPYISSGLVSRLKPGSYKKMAELDDPAFIKTAPKADKKTVAARLDKWYASLDNGAEFTAPEAAEVAESPSVYFVKEWLKSREADGSLTKMGSTRGTAYRKSKKMLGAVIKVLKARER